MFNRPRMFTRTNWVFLPAGVLCAGLLLVGRAHLRSPSRSTPETFDSFAYTTLSYGQVGKLLLSKVGSIAFGDSLENSVYEFTAAVLVKNRFYILDRFATTINVYSDSGQFLFRFGRRGRGPGEMIAPYRIAYNDGHLVVTDLAWSQGMHSFSMDGIFLRALQTRREIGSITGLASSGNNLVFLRIPSGSRQWRAAGHIIRSGAESDKRFCAIPSAYTVSYRHNGILGRNPFGFLAKSGDVILCGFEISPIVQVFDTTGEPLRCSPKLCRELCQSGWFG